MSITRHAMYTCDRCHAMRESPIVASQEWAELPGGWAPMERPRGVVEPRSVHLCGTCVASFRLWWDEP
jgi:hypothetical protein